MTLGKGNAKDLRIAGPIMQRQTIFVEVVQGDTNASCKAAASLDPSFGLYWPIRVCRVRLVLYLQAGRGTNQRPKRHFSI